MTDEDDLYAHTISEAYNAHLKELDEDKTPSSTSSEPIQNGTTATATTTNGHNDNGEKESTPRHIVPGIDGLGDGLSKDGNERAKNMSILCGSMHPFEEAHASGSEKRESVFVFPDYKVSFRDTRQPAGP